MAFGTQAHMLAQLFGQPQPEGMREPQDDLAGLPEQQIPVGIRLQGRIQPSSTAIMNDLATENFLLRNEVRRMHNVVQNSKIETAELCSKFGKLANDWSETVKQINAMHDDHRKDYERRIKALEKTNEQLVKENEEMKKVIADFKKMESEFEEQKRTLRLGQIAFKLEELVSEYVFPGADRASKRARYGTNLKSLKGKIDNLKDQKLQEGARSRLEGLNEEMFEEWFLGIVKELKKKRVDSAHPNLGTYEEMRSMINQEFSDADKRADMLEALDRLQEMYAKMERNFGE